LCFDCHGVHATLDRADPTFPGNRAAASRTCGRCHRRQAADYTASSHARALEQGDPNAPACTDCHAAHPANAASPGGTASTCAICHERPEVLRRTGLPHARTEDGRRSFHSLALAHGATDVATCTSCHGAHLVVHSSDPRSPVSRERIETTCTGCHPRATAAMLSAVTGHGPWARARSWLRALEVTFPVARTRFNVAAVAAVGAVVAFVANLLGIGGGLLLTPLLILFGVPGAVAAASDSTQIAARATAAARSHARRHSVDLRIAAILACAGTCGGAVGVQVVRELRFAGTYELFLRFAFIVVLLAFGATIGSRSLRTLRGQAAPFRTSDRRATPARRPTLPMSAPAPQARTPVVLLLAAAAVAGVAAAVLGVGGGFLLLPILVAWARVPTRLAVGTASFAVAAISAGVALQHAAFNRTVDLVLAGILFLGGLLGARLGRRASRWLQRDRVRLFLSMGLLLVAAALAVRLLQPPPAVLLLGVPR